MRRIVALLATSTFVVAGLTAGSGLSPALGADPLTGRLVDSTTGSTTVPAANMTVQLREVTADGPGEVVASDVTDSDGFFSLDAGPSPEDEYYVRVLAGTYQGGWIGGGGPDSPRTVEPSVGYAVTHGPHATLGRVLALPAFVRGIVVNPATGNRVRGVTVRMIDGGGDGAVQGSDVTNRFGVFRIGGLRGEDDFGMRVIGSAKGYETGWRGCSGAVVATWGDACASPLGAAGKVRLDKL